MQSPKRRSFSTEPCCTSIDTDELYRRTSGNPFFVTEILAAAAAGIPDTVRDAVLARAARLGGNARALLEAISIEAPRIDLRLLEAIAGPVFDSLDESSRLEWSSATEPGGLPARARAPHDRGVAVARTGHGAPPGGLAALSGSAPSPTSPDWPTMPTRWPTGRRPGFAPRAGARAAAVGAHREAAAQYARALNTPATWALRPQLTCSSASTYESYATGQIEAAMAAQEEAVARPARPGDARRLGDALRSLGRLLGFAGRGEAGSRPPARPWAARGAPARPRARDGVRHARAAPPELGEHRPCPGARREGARARDGRERRRG